MISVNAVGAYELFSATVPQSGQLETLSNQALSRGIDQYQKKNYSAAIRDFRGAISLSPGSSYAGNAAKFMSDAYVKLGDVEGAIKAFRSYIGLNNSSDLAHINLGNLYYGEDRYEEAIAEYEKAVKINPIANNFYALGQAFLQAGHASRSEDAFARVIAISPHDAAGNFGLGQAYAQQGRYEEAIEQFETAIDKKNDFYDAYAEMGFTCADMGDIEKAMEVFAFLEDKAPELADTLSRYIYKVDPPKIMFASAMSTFPYMLPKGTAVAALDAYLATAGNSKSFLMKFQFDKQMDRESVENVAHWQITRASGAGVENYNFGLSIPLAETRIRITPDYVIYDPVNMTATVLFKLYQNAGADATIDPSHIQFQFSGEDAYGLNMDPARDQFTGFSGVF